MVQMSPSRKPMPSFTHVLTSGCHSVAPTTIHVDSYASPQMLPTPPDYWMVCRLFCVRKPLIYAIIQRSRMSLAKMPTRRLFLKQSKLVIILSKYVSYQQRTGLRIHIPISRFSCSSFVNLFLINGTWSITD